MSEHKPTENDCGIRIARLDEKDNGVWKCSVSVVGPGGDFESIDARINVTVAVPPARVLLRMDDQEVLTQSISFRLAADQGEERNIDCVATDARPRPEFKWFIGNTEIQVRSSSLIARGRVAIPYFPV